MRWLGSDCDGVRVIAHEYERWRVIASHLPRMIAYDYECLLRTSFALSLHGPRVALGWPLRMAASHAF